MPSVKNPNKPSKNRIAAKANKVRKQRQKESAAGRHIAGVVKSDLRHGARPGLLPTSGPRKPLSSKAQRKLDKKLGHALKRKMEAEGEVEMKGMLFSTNFYCGVGALTSTNSVYRCLDSRCGEQGESWKGRGGDGARYIVRSSVRSNIDQSLTETEVDNDMWRHKADLKLECPIAHFEAAGSPGLAQALCYHDMSLAPYCATRCEASTNNATLRNQVQEAAAE